MIARQRNEDIVCFEVGSSPAAQWTGSRHSLGEDLQALESLPADTIKVDVNGDQVMISGATRVGMIVLPSGRRLRIRSKIPNLTLLNWLMFLGEFPDLTSWLSEAGVVAASRGDDWNQCIAKLYLSALEILIRRHILMEYAAVPSEDSTIRGRILSVRLAQRLHRLPRVPQIRRRRTPDTPYNIVLALALDRLLAHIPMDDLSRLGRLRDQWASIRREVDDPMSLVEAAQWAAPSGYRGALQLARLILVGSALDPESNVGGRAFTLPLAAIWERALRRMFDRLAGAVGWQSLPDEERTRRWDDSSGRDDPARWLKADAIGKRLDFRWVLDAKYKCEFGDESRNDRFQMCAYAVAFDANRVSLVYPTATTRIAPRRLLCTIIGGKKLSIDSFALPMAAGPEACISALATIMEQ